METHRLLNRQIRKFLSDVDWETNPSMVAFIESINEAYHNHQKDQKLNQNAFDIASKEYEEITQKLSKENQLVEKVYKALLGLLSEDTLSEDRNNALEEKDLLKITKLVETEIEKRNQKEKQLQKAIALAKKASMAKTEFLSTMSHEIRSPMNVIIGLTHLLLDEEHLDTQVEYLNALEINANNLKLIINDVLDFSKIEAGKLELEVKTHSLKEELEQICKANTFSAKENENTISLEYDDALDEWYVFDKVRLGQVITNLVSNAVKFTKRGKIVIKASLQEKNDQHSVVTISVTDTGIGISKKAHQTIFEDFMQAENFNTRSHGGTGLGLAISRKLLHLMNAEIELESELGKGSTFYFDISLEHAQKQHLQQEIEGVDFDVLHPHKSFRVLVVEDAQFNFMVIYNLLKKENIHIDHAVNGIEAIEFVKNNTYNLVLMDVQMPLMDGIEATQRIREFDTQTPIFALTASSTQSSKELVSEVGMDDFISKPIDPKPFKKKILEFLYQG